MSIIVENSEHEGADATSAFDSGAIEHLFRIYDEGNHHLRWAIRTAHVALTEACDASSDRITAASIDAAVAADR